MTRLFVVGVLGGVLAVGAAGCGKSAEQQQAEQQAAAAQQMAKGAEQMAQGAQGSAQAAQQGMQQMLQGMQQMTGQAPGSTPVKLVDYTELKALMPDFAGWEKSGVKGQQTTMIVSVSNAEAHYAKGDASMKLEITDTSFSQAMLVPFAMFMHAGYEEKSDDGFKKGITLAGNPGFEEWEKDSKHAQVTLVVGNRFLVQADGNGVADVTPAEQLVQAVNLGKLAGLK